MSNKTIVITGTTSGIGYITARELAKEGHTLYLLNRNREKAEQVKDQITALTSNDHIHLVDVDLASMTSVDAAVSHLQNEFPALDVLINNAGGIIPQYYETEDGFEYTFAMNHLGHFHLTTSLLPHLKHSDDARIINVSSEAHRAGKLDFDNLMLKHKYAGFKAYANAKLCNIYFAKALTDRLYNTNVTANALHPGVVNTQFGHQYDGIYKLLLKAAKPFMVSPEKGAQTTLHLATDAEGAEVSGAYFKDQQVKMPARIAEDKEARELLWTASEELVAQALSVTA